MNKDIVVESAPVTKPALTPEQKRELHQRLRARLSKSKFAVDKCPPGFTPYWARKDDVEEMSRLDILGFRIVKDSPDKPRYQAHGLKADGTYQIGDVILMEVPTDEYEFYQQENLDRAHQIAYGVPDSFIAEAASQNVPAFEVDDKHKRMKG